MATKTDTERVLCVAETTTDMQQVLPRVKLQTTTTITRPRPAMVISTEQLLAPTVTVDEITTVIGTTMMEADAPRAKDTETGTTLFPDAIGTAATIKD